MLNKDVYLGFAVQNGEIVKTEEFDYGRTGKIPGVYEVIRIIDGVPLFLERHLERFKSSSKLLGYELKHSDEEITAYIQRLIEANGCMYGNVKIIINNLNQPFQDAFAFFIKSKYPSQSEIEDGVPVILYHGERNNPNAKSTDLSLREKINLEISINNAYEALLVNSGNEITEGSRSNVFMVKGNAVYTSPAGTVLPGVTRGYVMDICQNHGLKVVESSINTKMLAEFDGLFITGTSPQVLPISRVGQREYLSSSNPVITDIRNAYESMVRKYVEANKK